MLKSVATSLAARRSTTATFASRCRVAGAPSASSSLLSTSALNTTRRFESTASASSSSPMSTTSVLAVWCSKGSEAPTKAPEKQPTSKALQFVLGNAKRAVTSTRTPFVASSSTSEPTSLVACSPLDVTWVMCERMDFHVQYAAPAGWYVRESARENHVAIQCFPAASPSSSQGDGDRPPGRSASAGGTAFAAGSAQQQATSPSPSSAAVSSPLHGISMNCFAYHRKVEDPSSEKLMDTFLKRFATTCEGGVIDVVRRSSITPLSQATPPHPTVSPGEKAAPRHGEMAHWTDKISSQVGGSVCEVMFDPRRPAAPDGEGTASPPSAKVPRSAHGLCRAFYSSNRRFHYIMLAVVPAEEYAMSERLLAHVLMHFGTTKSTGSF